MARTRAQSRAEALGEPKPIMAKKEAPTVASKPTQSTRRKRKGLETEEPHPEQVKRKSRAPSRTGPTREKAASDEAKATDMERRKYRVTTSPSSIIAKIDNLIAQYGDLPLSDVGLPSPNEPTPDTILAHILNALLSSARISHTIAKRALQGLIQRGYHDLTTLKASTWKERVVLLDEAGYVRYDFKTASELGKLATFLKNRYESDVTKILPSGSDSVSNRKILRDHLKEISGLGPLGIEIFTSTVQMTWPPLCPFIDSRDLKVAEQIGLSRDVDAIYKWLGDDPEKMARLSAALTKIRLEKHVGEFS